MHATSAVARDLSVGWRCIDLLESIAWRKPCSLCHSCPCCHHSPRRRTSELLASRYVQGRARTRRSLDM